MSDEPVYTASSRWADAADTLRDELEPEDDLPASWEELLKGPKDWNAIAAPKNLRPDFVRSIAQTYQLTTEFSRTLGVFYDEKSIQTPLVSGFQCVLDVSEINSKIVVELSLSSCLYLPLAMC